MTDLEGRNFRLAGWIAERHTKGTGSFRTGLFWGLKKLPRPEASHGASPLSERKHPVSCRQKRTLNDAIALRAQIETVAAKRRALPPGGKVSEDYVFERIGKKCNATEGKDVRVVRFARHPVCKPCRPRSATMPIAAAQPVSPAQLVAAVSQYWDGDNLGQPRMAAIHPSGSERTHNIAQSRSV